MGINNIHKNISKYTSQKKFWDKDIKINIHFPIRGRMFSYCIETNQKILNITDSGIDFSAESFQIPHITLYMGFVKNDINLKKIMNELYDLSRELESFEIFPTQAYLKEPNKNYIFIDTKQSQQIINLKEKVKNRLDKYIIPLNWDVVNQTPHITIGYIKKDFQLTKELIEKFDAGPPFWAEAIEISFSGFLGTCIGTIRTFELINNNSIQSNN